MTYATPLLPARQRLFTIVCLRLFRWLGGLTAGRWTYDQEVVGSTLGQVAISWLLPGWVSVCGQVNHISVYNQHQGQLSLLSHRGW